MGGGMGLSKKVQVWYCKRKKQGGVGGRGGEDCLRTASLANKKSASLGKAVC